MALIAGLAFGASTGISWNEMSPQLPEQQQQDQKQQTYTLVARTRTPGFRFLLYCWCQLRLFSMDHAAAEKAEKALFELEESYTASQSFDQA